MASCSSVIYVLSMCFVKLSLSLDVGSCATSMLKGRSSLAVNSDVVCTVCRSK